MRRKLSILLAAGFFIAITACIEFESQSVSFRHLPDKDTLLIIQQYNGICGGNKKEGLSKDEIGQLDTLMTSAQTFFFSNWLLQYDREESIKIIQRLSKPAEPDDRLNDPAARERLRVFNKLLVDNITILNGQFYLDQKGKLCGIQKITIANISKILAAANNSIRDLILSELADGVDGFSEFSDETRHLLRQAAGGNQSFLQIEGNRLTFRWPIALDDVIKHILNENKEDKEDGFWFRNFARGGLEFAYVKNNACFSIGSKDAPFSSLTAVSLGKVDYTPNAVQHVKTKFKLQEGFDIAKVRDEFFGLAKPAKR